jgi:glycosyltransferase involved in cell wall biosynthesis
MKILLTLPRPLFPPDTGGKIRTLEIFRRLAARNEIYVVSFADRDRDVAGMREMSSIFKNYIPVFWREPQNDSVRFYIDVLANQFGSSPYFLAKCEISAFQSTVQRLLARQHFDVLVCDFLHTAGPLRSVGFRPRVVFEHNVEFMLRKRKWRLEKRPFRKLILRNEWTKTQRVETEVCKTFDHVITVSREDHDIVRREFGIDSVSFLPTGVDSDFFRPVENSSISGRLAFIGSMDWAPNEDAMIWFIREVFPRVRVHVPNATVEIVGRNPSSRLRELASNDPSITVTGWVPDVRPYLAEAEAVIVPLRIGGGTRIKIPEAMAMRKAVVSTPIGAEGLPFRDRRDIRLAERADEFGHAVVELLKDKLLRNSIATAAREVVARDHTWEAVADSLQRTLDRVICSDMRATAA